MGNLTVARRYAGALLELAEAEGSTSKVDADVVLIRDAIAGSEELRRLFVSPVTPRKKKEQVVTALFGDRVQPETLRFIQLMVAKRREDHFPDVVRAYQDLRDDQMGIMEVEVRCARALAAEDEKAIASSLEKRLKKRVRLSVTVDAALIGGLVVRVGDTVYDGSVSNRLATLKERLTAGAVLAN